ncbi:MAG: glutamate racemase [Treponema sp.]|jgi:glutamate racemase|nr:glutamate racemase [Treponema sp.]
MDKRPLLFLDSGAGGLPYGRYFHGHNPAETLIYMADRENFPYGPKGREELIGLLILLMERLIPLFDPKLVVLACNTASVSALAALRDRFPALPFVGTVPAIKPAVLASRSRRIGVLGTSRTIEDPYIGKLAARYGADCALKGLAAPDLVDFVEHRLTAADEAARRQILLPYIEEFARAGVDAVVLGCTHFLFLLDDFKAAAPPGMGIYDSVEGVCRRAESLLDARNLRAAAAPGTPGTLVLSGGEGAGPVWRQRARDFSLRLRLLDAYGAVKRGEAFPRGKVS